MEGIKNESDKLKLEYCKEIGSDSIIGLDVCDDYKNWLKFKDLSINKCIEYLKENTNNLNGDQILELILILSEFN